MYRLERQWDEAGLKDPPTRSKLRTEHFARTLKWLMQIGVDQERRRVRSPFLEKPATIFSLTGNRSPRTCVTAKPGWTTTSSKTRSVPRPSERSMERWQLWKAMGGRGREWLDPLSILQGFEEGEDAGILGLSKPSRRRRDSSLAADFGFHPEVGLQVVVGRIGAGMPEPERDDLQGDTRLEQMQCGGVPKSVR